VNLVQGNEPSVAEQDQTLDIERVKSRLDMLDRRLDNIDSMVTAVAERVMKQPLTINIVCPHCGKDIEIAVLGNEKPRR
jgi:tetrahydromethanopterin S-methyltransferase subunit G